MTNRSPQTQTRQAPQKQGVPKKPGLLSGLAFAVGAGALAFYVLDLHKHKCACGKKWMHFGAFNMGDEASHTCDVCGQVQWWRNGEQHVLRGSQFAAPPLTPPASPPPVQTYVPPAVPAYVAYVPVQAQVAPPPPAPASSTALVMQPKAWPW